MCVNNLRKVVIIRPQGDFLVVFFTQSAGVLVNYFLFSIVYYLLNITYFRPLHVFRHVSQKGRKTHGLLRRISLFDFRIPAGCRMKSLFVLALVVRGIPVADCCPSLRHGNLHCIIPFYCCGSYSLSDRFFLAPSSALARAPSFFFSFHFSLLSQKEAPAGLNKGRLVSSILYGSAFNMKAEQQSAYSYMCSSAGHFRSCRIWKACKFFPRAKRREGDLAGRRCVTGVPGKEEVRQFFAPL